MLIGAGRGPGPPGAWRLAAAHPRWGRGARRGRRRPLRHRDRRDSRHRDGRAEAVGIVAIRGAVGARARRCFGKRLRPDEPRLRPVRASVGRGAAAVRTGACRRVGDRRKRRPASHGGPTAPRRRTGPPRGRHGDDPDERGRLGGDRGRRRLGPACDADRESPDGRSMVRHSASSWLGDDGSAFAGERIASIDGVLTLVRPGIVAVSQDGGAVEATVAAGIRLDPAWAGDGLARIRVRDGSGPFGPRDPAGGVGGPCRSHRPRSRAPAGVAARDGPLRAGPMTSGCAPPARRSADRDVALRA